METVQLFLQHQFGNASLALIVVSACALVAFLALLVTCLLIVAITGGETRGLRDLATAVRAFCWPWQRRERHGP